MFKTLIVDDELLAREGLLALVPWERFNLKVVGEACNGQKALEFIMNNEVDLLITDISMPVMSGFDLIKEVRKRYPHIWVVILTCHQDFDFIQEALRMGAIDYIVKTQMEIDKINEIFMRISDRISQDKPERSSQTAGKHLQAKSVECDTKEQHSDRELLHRQLSSVNWIYNHKDFDKVISIINRIRLNTSEVKKILTNVFKELNQIESFRLDDLYVKQLEECDSISGFDDWLTAVRIHICKRTQKLRYSDEVIISIVNAVLKIRSSLGSVESQNDLAREVNLCRSYFSQSFRDIVGRSYSEFLKEIRISRAKDILINTNKPVYWIAEELGFNDEKYFSKLFREYTGMVPTEFRNRYVPE